jgi:hypothetical protein
MKAPNRSVALLVCALCAGGAVVHAAGSKPRTFQPNPPPPPMQSQGTIIVPGRAPPGPNCRYTCATQCENVGCSGLNVSQCLRARQACRVTCTSRC